MIEQAKIERVLKLLFLLSGNFGYKIKEISEKLEISERTIYRYIDTFRGVGLVVEKNKSGYWKIDKKESQHKELHELLHFSEEESYILQKAIHAIDDNNALKSNLVSKLYSLYNSERIIETIVKKENSETISKLTKAIQEKLQIQISDYKSANSNSVSNRILEPIKFTSNFVSIWCFEPETKANKLFKIARINKVQLLDKNWEFEHLHKPGFMDCFRISSDTKIAVKMEMTIRARNLLIEEYPLSEKNITEINPQTYIFEGEVCNYMGIGRFVLGLSDDIKVHSPSDFKDYLNNRIKNKIF